MIELKDRRTGEVRYSFDVENVRDITNLNELDLTWIALSCTDLTDANLYNAKLRGADLTDADLTGSDLRWSCLTRADLSNADLSNADLTRSDLSNADLTRSDLRGANLSNTDLRWSCLTRADLRGVQGLVFSSIQFNSMGEKGRTLIYFQNPKDKKMYFQCGCFFGDENTLLKYIEDGESDLKESRLYALETVKTIMQYNLKGKN